jgi:uncharacterized protein with von Willebrand factor type A (vWA) domain
MLQRGKYRASLVISPAWRPRIVEFAEVLRQNGVRVATSELLDATGRTTWSI